MQTFQIEKEKADKERYGIKGMRLSPSKAVAIVSGGIDSSTMIYDMKNRGLAVYALTFNYGQLHKKEIYFAEIITNKLGVADWQVVEVPKLSDILKSALTEKSASGIPHEHYTHESQKATIVPNRNMIFLSIAAGYAQSIGAQSVWYAAHHNDSAIYPDCRPEFVNHLRSAILAATEYQVALSAPYIDKTKADIVCIGRGLNVPYQYTWSCYEGTDRPCLSCGTCRERTEAFMLNDIKDPFLTEEEWNDAQRIVALEVHNRPDHKCSLIHRGETI